MPRVFDNGISAVESPAFNAFPVTPSDTVDLAHVACAIYCGGAGDLSLVTVNGDTVTLVALVSGLIHPITASRIRATGTTATSILALY
jgi:hypothetical protein